MDEKSSLYQPVAQERQKINGLAIASFTCGILGYLFAGLFILLAFARSQDVPSMPELGLFISLGIGFLLSGPMGLAAIIVGAIAIRKIKISDR